MYQITSNNIVLGYTDSIEYCYRLPSGSPQVIGPVEKKNGFLPTSVIYRGEIYNLPGYNEFEAETAVVTEIDQGSIIADLSQEVAGEKTITGGQKAQREYQPGEYITLNGTLYRVTISIPAGNPIAPGTNVKATTIVDELSVLNN